MTFTPLHPTDPRQVGSYRLLGRLGGGGMGQVYLGRSPGGRDVAVKLIHPEFARDAEFRRRFAVEVEAAKRVGGFFTAQVIDAEPAGDPPWMVSAYVPGPSLQTAVSEQGVMSAPATMTLGAGLVEALSAIHACGLIHRDLKPGNVLLAPDGPRVIDFGIARAMEGTAMTATGAVIGTPAYMSPEQVRGHPVGPESDVFSLGCVLAFAVTGRSPFGEGSYQTVLYRIVHEEPELSAVPEPLRPLVDACLAKDPRERPTPARFLERLTGSAPPTAAAPDPGVTTVRQEAPAAPPGEIRFQTPSGAWTAGACAALVAGLVLLAVALRAGPGLLAYEVVPIVLAAGCLIKILYPTTLTIDATGIRVRLARPWQRDLGPFTWDQITKIGPVPLTAPGADRPRLYLAVWGQGITQDPARARPLFPLGLRGLPWDEIQAVVSRYRPDIEIGH